MEFKGQVMVKVLLDVGLVGLMEGLDNPQSTHDGEETENEMV